MDLKIETTESGVTYTLKDNEFNEVVIECSDEGQLKVTGPAVLMSKAIGGRGDDNGKTAWFQDKDFKTASEAVSNVMEIIKEMLKTQEL